jgi:hypothetical protein
MENETPFRRVPSDAIHGSSTLRLPQHSGDTGRRGDTQTSLTGDVGARVDLRVVVTNHSAGPQQAACRGLLHPATSGRPTEWRRAEIAAKSEQEIRLSLAVPGDAAPGRHVLSIDVRFGPWDLPQFTEAIVMVPG